jgi:hydrogenase maturation protein HypF
MCRQGRSEDRPLSFAHWSAIVERRAILVRGIVQGVGSRLFVYNLARRLHLGGFVRNQTGSLRIEVEGDTPSPECFLAELAGKPPPLAQIEHLSWERHAVRGDTRGRRPSSWNGSQPERRPTGATPLR